MATPNSQNHPHLQKEMKKTQEVLGNLITRPVLLDQYLKRPPFRFLHDVVISIITETGFMQGVFNTTELNFNEISNSVDAKRLFLNKLIITAIETTGQSIDIRPSKILAGQEAEKTNQLLQLLAEGIRIQRGEKKIDDDDGGDGDCYKKNEGQKSDKKVEKSHTKKVEIKKVESVTELVSVTLTQDNLPQINASELSLCKSEAIAINPPCYDTDSEEKLSNQKNPLLEDDVERVPKTSRPVSARRPPPKNSRSNSNTSIDSDCYKEKVVNMIIEGDETEELDQVFDVADEVLDNKNNFHLTSADLKGLLVNQIIASAKEMDFGLVSKKLETLPDQQRNNYIIEIEKLKSLIQDIAKNANPLGRFLEFTCEDVHLIQKEFQQWSDENLRLDNEILRAKESSLQSIHPLNQALEEVQLKIQSKQNEIISTKVAILKLESRISSILNGLDRITPSDLKDKLPSSEEVMKMVGGDFPTLLNNNNNNMNE